MRAYLSERLARPFRQPPGWRGGPWRSRLRRVVRYALFAVLSVVVAGIVAVLPLRWIDPPTTAFMLFDPNDSVALQHTWTDWHSISPALPLAVVAAEDQKFAQHFGFDVESIQDSIADRTAGKSLRGASTISQQVVKNLYLWRGRSFIRKGIEAYLTVVIEVALPKRRILEIYLNVAEFGPGIYGVGAASRVYFGKPAGQVNDSEAALLAAVLPNPNRLHAAAPSEYVRERQRWIYGQMQRLRREHWLYLIDD